MAGHGRRTRLPDKTTGHDVQVNIRSDDVEVTADPTRSDITCRFNRPIQIPSGIKTLITLVSAQIPNSFYSIPTDTQITFSLATSGSVTVIMPAGTYSISEWYTKLNKLLTQSDAPICRYSTSCARSSNSNCFPITHLMPSSFSFHRMILIALVSYTRVS